MRAAIFISTFLSGAVIGSAIPATDIAARQANGVEPVPGIGQTKQAILNVPGSNTLILAAAMQETRDLTSNYAYGDNKSGDSANFGIFKQNWGLLRQCCSQFVGRPAESFTDGDVLNGDLNADVTCVVECMAMHGEQMWMAGHRAGSCGMTNPGGNQRIIDEYVNGVRWIQQQLDTVAGAQTDDNRYYANVPAIVDGDVQC